MFMTTGFAGALKVDATLSRLDVLRDRIEATEALVTLDLDHRRNELVAFDLVSTAPLSSLHVQGNRILLTRQT
jgi:hypothetical protein